MKTTKLLLCFSVLLLLLNAGCTYAVRYDGTYSGKVIDADTGQPIEAVVVLGTWHKVMPTVAGGVSSYYDARETVTDKNGEFSIPGMGLRIMSNLEPMHFLIFKAGYEHIGPAHWATLKVDAVLSKKVKWEGSKAIIHLRKLTIDERRRRLVGKESLAPDNKQKRLIKELNKESREFGGSLYPEVN